MKHVKKVAVVFLAIILLTGCWNRRELNELVIALAIGVDKTDNGYSFTVQLINPTTSSQATKKGAVGATVRSTSAEGETLFEAWRKLTKLTPRKVYFAHVQLLVLDEELVKEGLKSLLDPLIRDHELRNDFYVVVSKNQSAKDVLSILTYIEPIPALSLKSMITSSNEHYGSVTAYKFDEMLEDLSTKGKELAITGVILEGDPQVGRTSGNIESSIPETKVILDNLAVFKDDQLVGWFNEKQSKGYNYSQGNIISSTEVLNCPGSHEGKLTVEIIRTDSKLTARIDKKSPVILSEIEVEGNLVDVECKLNPSDLQVLENIQNQLADNIKSSVEDSIKVSQKEFHSDIIGFGSALHRKEPSYWKKHQDEWDELFPDIRSKVNVKAKIHNTGTLGEALED
ncbi:Ger(x)C family spore germination protein (plasmid) [Cytobacillus spongiae]|uniref:Ger(x)C family spore germination protein n=1 Tax=Cytobacillus spongiae TaxID=2901381 RepID=UPI001F237DB8|nr:Ger(x)C family spore germination protein [Cytobacillus spongiae]UII58643.1 Ger(x)C family spore germination protein [Cytobacillus spongiae]